MSAPFVVEEDLDLVTFHVRDTSGNIQKYSEYRLPTNSRVVFDGHQIAD